MCSLITCPAVAASILPNVGGWIAGYQSRAAVKDWYETLNKPNWRPPNAAFGPVWTVLYTSMGYASYRVWRAGGGFGGPAHLPLAIYGGHLILNWAWSPIFFNARSIKGALIDIILLDIAAVGTAFHFYEIDKVAGYLFIPYLAWLGLATVLNYVLYRDNREIKDTKEK